MKARLILVWVMAFASAACRETAPPAEVSKPAQHEHAGADHHDDAPPHDVLRIDTEMLRDLRVTTGTVERRPGGEGVNVLGELEVNQNTYAEVGTPIAARITAVYAAPGEGVHPGQPLAQLRSVELGKARASYMTALAKLRFAEQTLERKRRLAAERIVSTRDVQSAEADAATARSSLAGAAAALQALGLDADTPAAVADDPSAFELRAPIDATVIDRKAVVGQFADPTLPLFRLADLSTLWLTVHAFERDAVRIQPGAVVRVSFPALPGRSFGGRVAYVGRLVDPGSRTIPVRVDLPNPEDILRPGMSATAWVKLGSDDDSVLAVPAAALQRVRGEWAVFIPRGNGLFEIRAVGRGRELDGEVELLSGVRAGETIVVDGAFLLKAEADKARGGSHDHAH